VRANGPPRAAMAAAVGRPVDTARAHRRYDAAEPENRLLARTLERVGRALLASGPWRYARLRQAQPHGVTAEHAEIAALAATCPRSGTRIAGVAEKRRIVRSGGAGGGLGAASSQKAVHLHWSLGTVTRTSGEAGRVLGAVAVWLGAQQVADDCRLVVPTLPL
jgi:hypothetical protein